MLVVDTYTPRGADLAVDSSETCLETAGRVGMVYSYRDRGGIARTWPLGAQCCGDSWGIERAPCRCGSQAFVRAALGNFRIGDLRNQGDLLGKMAPAVILERNQGTRVMLEGNQRYFGIRDAAALAVCWGTFVSLEGCFGTTVVA